REPWSLLSLEVSLGITHMLVGVRCRVSGVRENLTPGTWSPTPASLLATSATGPHPFPSRTRSLSLSAPMVLRLRGRGRVGRRQLSKPERRRATTSRGNVTQRRHAKPYHGSA